MHIIVIGASGGIGLAIVKRCLEQFPSADIVATYYEHCVNFSHPQLRWQSLDVTNESAIEQLAADFDSVDIIINAVGFLHGDGLRPEKSIKQFDKQLFSRNTELNTLPSIYLAKHFQRALKASKREAFFVALSAKVGSISDNRLGGWLSYRTSKAALNMAIKTISLEWQRTLPNCCVVLFHPGTTDTALSKPFQKHLPQGQLHSAADTASCLLDLLERLSPTDSGKFLSYDGNEIVW